MLAGAERAGRARPVLDHDRLPEMLLGRERERAHADVGAAARRPRHDQRHRPRRELLRLRDARQAPATAAAINPAFSSFTLPVSQTGIFRLSYASTCPIVGRIATERTCGVLAPEDRTGGIFLGRSGQARRKGRGVDRRAQFHRARKPESHEERRARLLLPHRRREAGRRHRRDHPRGLQGPDRREGRVLLRRHARREAVPRHPSRSRP